MQYVLTQEEYDALQKSLEKLERLQDDYDALVISESHWKTQHDEYRQKFYDAQTKVNACDSKVINIGIYEPEVADILVKELSRVRKSMKDGKISCGSISGIRRRGRGMNEKAKELKKEKKAPWLFRASIPLEYAKRHNIYIQLG